MKPTAYAEIVFALFSAGTRKARTKRDLLENPFFVGRAHQPQAGLSHKTA